jgi:hypothetical protein
LVGSFCYFVHFVDYGYHFDVVYLDEEEEHLRMLKIKKFL